MRISIVLLNEVLFMTLENLKKFNPKLAIYGVDSPEFKEYGRRITDIDTSEIVSVGSEFNMPESGTVYEPSTPAFEVLSIAKEITDKCFGQLDAQIGFCYGYNDTLNALEIPISRRKQPSPQTACST